ncbi:MAG: helix-turn-helix domain-containing protein [Leptospirales bacterium]
MEKEPLQQLLRTFFRYEVSLILLFNEKKSIEGAFFKSDIESLMSDLESVQLAEAPPLRELSDLESLLELFQQYGVLQDNIRVLPAVDFFFEVQGLLGRREIIDAWGELEEAEQLIEFEPSRKKPSFSEPVDIKKIITKTPKPKIIISQAGSEPSPQVEKVFQGFQTSLDANPNLSLLALEALPLPMLAVDLKGKTLFFNNDWDSFRVKYPHLETLDLMDKAKDKMARMAFEGDLTIQSTLEFSDFVPRAILKMRSLLDERGSRPTVIGYLFWIDRDQATSKLLANSSSPEETEKPVSSQVLLSAQPEHRTGYSGKSLNDILADEEKKALSWAITEADGNQTSAAALLGLPRQTFAYRYKKYFY